MAIFPLVKITSVYTPVAISAYYFGQFLSRSCVAPDPPSKIAARGSLVRTAKVGYDRSKTKRSS
jgi:hypothetical protein